jgi:GAF domain-containing protein
VKTRAHRPGGEFARPPLPADEPSRLEALRSYEILDTPDEQPFDDLALLASYICETPFAMVSLIDEHRQWFKARIGTDLRETPRDLAFCAHAIAGSGTMVVPDLLEDERFARHPLVVQDPQVRFYAGAPLRTGRGSALGTLCVLDRVPHDLADKQLRALEALSRQVMTQLELRRHVAEIKRLRGLLPFCAQCGKLRTDVGDICPECLRT